MNESRHVQPNYGHFAGPIDSGLGGTQRRVLADTLKLLTGMIAVSIGVCWFAVSNQIFLPLGFSLIGFVALMALTWVARNSLFGLIVAFGWSVFVGAMTALPIAIAMSRGLHQEIAMSAAMTGAITLGMSMFGVRSDRPLTWGRTLMIGVVVTLAAMLINVIWIQSSVMAMTVMSMVALLSAGIIAYTVAAITRGGETNYILAAIDLFLAITNIFRVLLALFISFDD